MEGVGEGSAGQDNVTPRSRIEIECQHGGGAHRNPASGEVLCKIRPRGLMADEHETFGVSAAASGDVECGFGPVAVEVLGDLER